MGSFNQMCMVSNVPVKPDAAVKVFFLVSNGDYRNQKTIMTGAMPNPWSAFKVFGGMCVDAVYRGYNRFDVVKNEKSDFLLDLLKKLTGEPDMDFTKVFELIDEGKLACPSLTRENVFMNIACVHDFAYEELIYHGESQKAGLKEKLMEQISRINEVINRANNDNHLPSEDKAERAKDLMLRHMNFFDEYTPMCLDNDLGKCAFYLFSQHRPELTEQEVFDRIADDLVLMDGLYELGVTLSPKSLNHEIANESLREKVLKKGMEYFLNDYYDEESVEVRKRVKVIQEVTKQNLTDYLEECGDYMPGAQEDFERFIEKHEGQSHVYIEAKNVASLLFLKESLRDKEQDVLILL